MRCDDLINSLIFLYSDNLLSTTLTTAVLVDSRWEKRFFLNKDNEFTNDNKAKSIGLEKHLQMSLAVGLVGSDQNATMRYL